MANNLTININDYLSESKKAEIVIEEFRKAIRSRLDSEKEITRIISNACYHAAFAEIDQISLLRKEDIKAKVYEIIEDPKSYSVFRNHYMTGKPESTAAIFVDESVAENKDLIKRKVKESLESMNLDSKVLNVLEQKAEDLSSMVFDIIYSLKKEQ